MTDSGAPAGARALAVEIESLMTGLGRHRSDWEQALGRVLAATTDLLPKLAEENETLRRLLVEYVEDLEEKLVLEQSATSLAARTFKALAGPATAPKPSPQDPEAGSADA